MDRVLVPLLHPNPGPVRLLGLPRLQVTAHLGGAAQVVALGNGSGATRRLLGELSEGGGATAQ